MKTKSNKTERILDDIFRVSILLKFIIGLLEIFGALILTFASQESLNTIVRIILGDELIETPRDFLVHFFLQTSSTINFPAFLAFYLLIHGLIKVGLVISLWAKKPWAYPLAAVVLTVFTAYQVYLIIHTHSIFQIILTLLDVMILILLRFEYKRIRRQDNK